MARKKRVTSLETGIATLGPAPELSTTPVVRGDEAGSLSPAVVTYRRVLAERRTPIFPARQAADAFIGSFPRGAAAVASYNGAASNSSDAHSQKSLPADLSAVLKFARRPVLAKAVKDDPLPFGIVRLMQIAAGSPEAVQHAVRLTGKDPAYLRAAIIFYLEHALWMEPRDSYRVLGATDDTPQDELAERVRWLMAWLHPYLGGAAPEALFADRVLRAWLAVKTPTPAKPEPQGLIDQGAESTAASRFVGARRASATTNGSGPSATRAFRRRRRRVRWSVAAAALVGLGALAAIAGSGSAAPFLHETDVGGLLQGPSAPSSAKTVSPTDGL